MKYLIVYAHPNPKSFNHAVFSQVEENLKRDKKEYIVRDLYSLNFNPRLDASDFIAIHDGKTPHDIATEQNYIKDADTIIFIHPIWWFGMPALLKGYVDRVFARGFAYDYDANGLKGLLPGKNVVILNTTGGDEATYVNYGFKDALKKTIETGTFELCGMKIVLHKYFYAVPTVSNDVRVQMLKEVETIKF